ncbi:HEAT repeat domain-containing protein [Nostoc sp. FACHB-87]|nr:HEAT repeat domain-containing protein [Nostoc sp. FACHB-87]
MEKILAWQEIHRPEYAAQLQSGLTEQEIEEPLKNLPFQLPKEVYELYRWRNGSRFDVFFPTGSGLVFLPLETAIEQYNLNAYVHSTTAEYAGSDDDWNPYYFPIFFEGIEMFFVIGHDKQQENSPVIYYFGEDGSHDIFCSSLTTMMQVIAECYDIGAYYLVEKQGRKLLAEDTVKSAQVLRKYNPELLDITLRELQQAQRELSYRKLSSIIYRLMWYKDLRTVEPLIQLLRVSTSNSKSLNEIFIIQSFAASILGELNDIRAVEPLIEALSNEYWITRCNAAESLGKLGENLAVKPLINTLQDSHKLVQNAAAVSLLFNLNAVDLLIEILSSDKAYVRLKVAEILGTIKIQEQLFSEETENKVIKALSELREDPDSSVREAVQKSLKRLSL